MNGNTFEQKKTTYGHAKKVWRSLRGVYPGGGTVDSDTISKWNTAKKDVIPAGSPAKIDMATKAVTIFTDSQITSASDVTTLGINGFTQEDIVLKGAAASNIVATATVVYAGELYEFVNATVYAKLKGLATIPQIVFVQ